MTTTPDILVIEDDPIMREALADWLQAAGYGVRTAADGSAGLAAVTAAPPALVVTDIHMPGMTAPTVISELKRRHPPVVIIAISGLFNSGHGLDAEAAIALGALGRWPSRSSARVLRALASSSGAPPPSGRCRR